MLFNANSAGILLRLPSYSRSARPWNRALGLRNIAFGALKLMAALCFMQTAHAHHTYTTSYYAAPYFANVSLDVSAGYCEGEAGGNINFKTVAEAFKAWEACMKFKHWGQGGFNRYVVAYQDDEGPNTGVFAVFEECQISGSNCTVTKTAQLFGKLQCPPGYKFAVVTSKCERNGPAAQKNRGCQEACANGSNPINAANGNKFQTEIDFTGQGPFPLRLVRYYNSNFDALGERIDANRFGKGWTHQYGRRVTHLTRQNGALRTIRAQREDGRVIYFNFATTNPVGWEKEPDIRDTATNNASGYLIRGGNGVDEQYDFTGRLIWLQQPGGARQTLAYDSDGRLDSVSDPLDRKLEFNYDESGNVSSVIDPAGNSFSYIYDESGNLVEARRPPSEPNGDPLIRKYVYGDAAFPNALTGIIDNNQIQVATWNYDAQGRAVSSEHAGGTDQVLFAYNPDGSATVTDSQNVSRTFTFQTINGSQKVASTSGPCHSCGAVFASTTYDSSGYVASRADFNGVMTTFVHNTLGQQTSRTEAFGTSVARTITTQWHSTLRVPTRITEPGRRTEFSYDPNGNMLTRTVTDTATNASRTTTWTYLNLGRVNTVNGPRTDVSDLTDYDYDTQGNLSRITNALGHVTDFLDYDAFGNPTRSIDANGVVTTFTYDAAQRLRIRAEAGAQSVFDYDADGQLTKVTMPDGSYLAYGYDDAHRRTDVVDNLGNRIHYTLDLAGNRTKEEIFDSSGSLKRSLGQVFDLLGRLKQVKNVGGQIVTEYGYDEQGNRTSQTDAGTYATMYLPDALNRIKQVTDAGSGITQYGYNALDQLVSVTDPNNLQTTYAMSAFGEVTQQVSPDTGTTSYTYDAAGNRKTRTDARGVMIAYSYDKLNRLTFVDYDGTVEDVTYSYDSTSQTFGTGRLTGLQDESGTTTLIYDARGNVTEEQRVIGSTTYTTSYTYDDADRLSGITYPSGRTVTYVRNTLGHVSRVATTVTNATTTLADSIEYMPFGGITSYTLGNGVAVTRTYDQDYRLQTLSDQGSAVVQDLALSYDLRSNVVAITDALQSNRSQTLGYDALSRLSSASGGYGTLGYAYDAVGNRLTETVTPPGGGAATSAYTYPADSHRLISISGGPTLSYDAAGNVTGKDDLTLTYNSAGRPVQVSGGATTVHAVYNAAGQRARKTVDGVTTNLHYDRAGHVIVEEFPSVSGTGLREYVWLDDQPLAVATTVSPSEAIVDNDDTGFSAHGAWQTASSNNGHYGVDYLTHGPFTAEGTLLEDDIHGSGTGWIERPAQLGPSNGQPYGAGVHQQTMAANDGFKWGFTGLEYPEGWNSWNHRFYARWISDQYCGTVDYSAWHVPPTFPGIDLTPDPEELFRTSVDQCAGGGEWQLLGDIQAGDVFGTLSIGLKKEEPLPSISYTPPSVAIFGAIADAVRLVPIGTEGAPHAEWKPPVPGTFDVYVRSIAGHDHSKTAYYEFRGSLYKVDQRTGAGEWTLLSRVTFSTQDRLSLEIDPDSSVVADAVRFVAAAGTTLPAQTSLSYFHNDHLGTPQKLSDPNQTIVWDAEYAPFGKTQLVTAAVTQPLRFPGQYFDAETGLHQNWHRDYDPSIGRYLQSDPLGIAAGPSTYAYASGNPIGNVDPTGQLDWRGTFEFISAGHYGLGGTWGTFVLTSDCDIDGRQASIQVSASFFGLGLGAPLGNTRGNIRFFDGESRIAPYQFNGTASLDTLGPTIGADLSSTRVRLGRMLTGRIDGETGFDASLFSASLFGTSGLDRAPVITCCRQ